MTNKKQNIEAEYFYRLRDISKLIKPENAQIKLVEFLDTVKPKKQRSIQQNKALHVDCELIAEKLNDAGKDMKKVLKQEIDIPWTMESVKHFIFKPVMKAMYQKNSTTEIEKNSGELEKMHDVIMRELGEKHGIEYHPFPHDPKKKKEMEEMMSAGKKPDYPKIKNYSKF